MSSLNFEIVKYEHELNDSFRVFTNKNSKKQIGIGNFCRKISPCLHHIMIDGEIQSELFNLKKIAKMLSVDYSDLLKVHRMTRKELLEDYDVTQTDQKTEFFKSKN